MTSIWKPKQIIKVVSGKYLLCIELSITEFCSFPPIRFGLHKRNILKPNLSVKQFSKWILFQRSFTENHHTTSNKLKKKKKTVLGLVSFSFWYYLYFSLSKFFMDLLAFHEPQFENYRSFHAVFTILFQHNKRISGKQTSEIWSVNIVCNVPWYDRCIFHHSHFSFLT